jgi:hypothetical protein
MSTHENVNRRYADLQTMLRDAFQAEGRGLVEMTISIQEQLPRSLVWELRSIGHIRNQVVHENLARVPKYFEPLCKEAMATLKELRKQLKARGARRTPAPLPPASAGTSEMHAKAKAPKTLKRPAKKKAKRKATASRR